MLFNYPLSNIYGRQEKDDMQLYFRICKQNQWSIQPLSCNDSWEHSSSGMQFSSSYANRKWNLFLIKGIQRKQNNNNEKFPSCFSPNKFLLKLKSQEQMLEQTAYIQAVMSSRFLDGNSNPIFPKPWSSPFPAPQRWNLESAIRFEWV